MAKKKKRRDDDVKPAKKGRGRAVEDDEDDDDFDDGDDADDSGPRTDVYVGLSVITLLALVTAAVFLYLDTDANTKAKLPTHTLTANALSGARQ